MRHKIKVYKEHHFWYVECQCKSGDVMKYPDNRGYFGRPTWDAAFALGVAHQKNADVAFPGGAKWPAMIPRTHLPSGTHNCGIDC